MAQRALEEVHGIAASEEDISFVFEKLEAGKPELLRGVPAGIVEPPVLWPCSASCNRCKQPLGAHRRPVKVTFLSSDSGKSQGVAMEMRCDVCASYFLGPWSYMRHDRRCGPAISDLSLLGAPDACATFVLPTPGLAAAYGCSVQDLKLISGTLHHARGLFQSASEVFADRSGCEDLRDDTHAHEILESLWYAWALHRFLRGPVATAPKAAATHMLRHEVGDPPRRILQGVPPPLRCRSGWQALHEAQWMSKATPQTQPRFPRLQRRLPRTQPRLPLPRRWKKRS